MFFEELDDELTNHPLPNIEPVNDTEMVIKAEPTPYEVSQRKTNESDDKDSYQPSKSSIQQMVHKLEQDNSIGCIQIEKAQLLL